jgi:hypothetical protein
MLTLMSFVLQRVKKFVHIGDTVRLPIKESLCSITNCVAIFFNILTS